MQSASYIRTRIAHHQAALDAAVRGETKYPEEDAAKAQRRLKHQCDRLAEVMCRREREKAVAKATRAEARRASKLRAEVEEAIEPSAFAMTHDGAGCCADHDPSIPRSAEEALAEESRA